MEFDKKTYKREVTKYSPIKGSVLKVNTKKLLKNSRINDFIDNIDYVDKIKHLPIRTDLYMNELVKRYKQKITTSSTRANSGMSRIETPQLTPYKGNVNFCMIRNDPTRNYRDMKKDLKNASIKLCKPTYHKKNMSRLVPINPTNQSYPMVNSLFERDRLSYSEMRYRTPNCLPTLPIIISNPYKNTKTEDVAIQAKFDIDEFKEIRQYVINVTPLKVLKEVPSLERESIQDTESDYEVNSVKQWEIS